MPERVRTYLLARLNPALSGFEDRVRVTFEASRRGLRAEESFSLEWPSLPEEHRTAIVELWERLQAAQESLGRFSGEQPG